MAFVEKHPHERGFSTHYQQRVEPALAGLREHRDRLLKRLQRRAWTAFAAVVLVAALTGVLAWLVGIRFPILVAGGVALTTLLGLAWSLSGPADDYEDRLRDTIMVAVTEFLGSARYTRVPDDDDLDIRPFEDAGILPFYNGRELRDHLAGHHRGLAYDSMDARLNYRIMGIGRVHFAGVLVAVPAPINAPVTLRLVKGMRRLPGAMRACFPDSHRFDLAGPLAEAGFTAYAEDKETGRIIAGNKDVWPLAGLPGALGDGPIVAALRDNLLLLALPRGTGRFEDVSLFDEPALIPDTARKMLKDAVLPIAIIDTLITGSSTWEPGKNRGG